PDRVDLGELLLRHLADSRPAERLRLDEAQHLEVAQRLADGSLARAQLLRDARLDEPLARRVGPVEDPLEDELLHLLAQRDACDPAQRSISPIPLVPFTRTRSPVAIRSVAIDVPTTAGIPNSRATTAGCAATPPASVTRPAIFVNRTTQAGFVIWQTRISPYCTRSASASEATLRATPS